MDIGSPLSLLTDVPFGEEHRRPVVQRKQQIPDQSASKGDHHLCGRILALLNPQDEHPEDILTNYGSRSWIESYSHAPGSEHVAQVGTVRGVDEDRLLEIGCAEPRPNGEREDVDQLLRLRAEQMRT